MFGKNPILPPKKSDGSKLEVKEIFATFQGEGFYTGHPAIFIRLGGCNLACNFCDTDFDDAKVEDLSDILAKVIKLANFQGKLTHNLIVITGGEPLRQNITPLCQSLLLRNFKIQIETNGTLYQDLPEQVKIVCSPKNNDNGYAKIRPDLLPKIDAFKFIISKFNKNYNHIPNCGQNVHKTSVYLQPMDEYDPDKNSANRQLTLKLASENGCMVSLQTHKIWGID